MQRIAVTLASGSSDVLVGSSLIERLGELISAEGLARPSSVITNTTVGGIYGPAATAAIDFGGAAHELEDGERFKRWPAVEGICSHWLASGVHRRHTVLGLGGGVVTDVTGFSAAVFLRGIQWVAVPTTLLAMVDAAVGGKTGVNLEQGKNLVGAFWPPRLVVADVDTLESLPDRELRAGLAEVVKTAWIGDHGLLDLLDSRRYSEIVARSVAVKARVVMEDEREAGGRKALNLGHTLGHALESATAYERFLHGEAVAWGLLAVAEAASRRGLLSADGQARFVAAVRSLGELPTASDLDPEVLLDHLGHDKKLDQHGVAWVLPTDHGVVLDQRLDGDEIRAVMTSVLQ